MKLYVTLRSPYARLAHILVLEKGLENRVEIIQAKTRTSGSPYYQINPSGRVPFLIDDAGITQRFNFGSFEVCPNKKKQRYVGAGTNLGIGLSTRTRVSQDVM